MVMETEKEKETDELGYGQSSCNIVEAVGMDGKQTNCKLGNATQSRVGWLPG